MPNSIVYNSDCLAAMREMPDKAFELAIVDPPYGIFGTSIKDSSGGTWANKYRRKSSNFDFIKECNGSRTSKYEGQAKRWDNAPSEEYFEELKRVSEHQIIWGANYFGHTFWNFVIWRKTTISETFTMSMAEIASVSLEGNGKVYEFQPQDKTRFHPTQKPVALYRWLLKNYAKPGDRILDTHVGSGSSRIACYECGFDFTGYEIDKDYFDAMEARFQKYISQGVLFK